MIELKFRQNNSQLGEVKLIMRIIGKVMYIKTNNEQYSEQMLQQLSSRGAKIMRGRGWLRINMFSDENELVKLGNKEFNHKIDPEEHIEKIIADFFTQKYIEAGFTPE